MILVIDNQSKFIDNIKEKLKEKEVKYKVCRHSEPPDFESLNDVKGIILSGGPGDPYGPLNVTADLLVLMKYDVPTIGLCLGHEIIAVANEGKISNLQEEQNRMENIVIDVADDQIFKGLKKDVKLRKKHYRHITKVPKDFEVLAHSDTCPVEIIKHKTKNIYGFQAHPEVSGEEGNIIINNFLKMCEVT